MERFSLLYMVGKGLFSLLSLLLTPLKAVFFVMLVVSMNDYTFNLWISFV